MQIEIIDLPIKGASVWDCPDSRVRKIILSAKSEQLRYDRGEKVSGVNEHQKFTRFVQDCTGIAVVGQDRSSGKQISFISHCKDSITFDVIDNYWANLPKDDHEKINMQFDRVRNSKNNVSKYENYEHLLAEAMKEMRNRCIPDTLDAVIFGGQVIEKEEKAGVITDIPIEKIEKAKIEYEHSLEALNGVSSSVLGIQPRVAHPPRVFRHDTEYSGGMTAVLDTKNRTFYDWIVY